MVIAHEVLHLGGPIGAAEAGQWGEGFCEVTAAVGGATEVKAGNVDPSYKQKGLVDAFV
jgi:hypothetical protein